MKVIIFLSLAFGCVLMPLQGAFTVKDGKLLNAEDVATLSVQEHYSLLLEVFQKEEWKEVVKQSNILIKNFPTSPFFQESYYYMAAAYFHLEDFDLANQHLTTYLRKQTALQHFREALELKFQVAEKFREGYKKHIGGYEALPQWMPAKDEAIKIYDEVINALPNDDLAAKALFGKAVILLEDDEYNSSIETYQTLIRRFPRHPLAPDAYVEIAKVYLIESQDKYPDADYLDLASINLRKFRQDFPTDDRLTMAEELFADMQEVYAKSFYEIAQFYERTKKPHASVLYYAKMIKTFPNTKSAELAKSRLRVLRPDPKPQIHEETIYQPTQESEHSRAS